jgi:hypothetical protein
MNWPSWPVIFYLAIFDTALSKPLDILKKKEAIRRLVGLALAGWQPPKARSAKARSRALDLAGAQIDKLSDPSASAEERQQRKRRLLKGPGEFREMRDAVRSKPKK